MFGNIQTDFYKEKFPKNSKRKQIEKTENLKKMKRLKSF